MAICPSCAHEHDGEFKFCPECGSRLSSEPAREERKVVTALFCDLVGSTALGEQMDHEDIAHLLSDYQAICRRRIGSHGGVIEKFIGDAVVGVFGVPAAHEDDPERAVRAALRILDDIGASELPIQVRIGVNTGEALVRPDVDPRSGMGFATGDTMNTTARLEAAAPVMGVAVGAATHAATQDTIVYEDLPPVQAKGKAEPLAAWRAVAPIARVGSTERDRTPFVGRELELSMLTRLAERSRTRGSVEFVTIVGDPGLGKSRLVRELARRVDELPDLVTWREGRCLPYGDGISFWALGEIVKAQAGILETDDQQALSTKLEAVLTERDPQMRTWLKDRLAPLVGLETTTAPPERTEAFTAWRTFLESLAAQNATVLVIEDLHWADDAFVTFLGHLVERSVGVPLLVVITARPELEDRHPSWPPGRRSTVLSLAPLEDADLTELVAASFDGASEELTRVVLERAGGSPLFAEQLAAMLAEQAMPIAGGALDTEAIPTSVQALIAARIDTLPSEPKRVLMEASVVGKTFWSDAVAALGEHADLEGALAELVRRELCRVMESTMAHEREFSFWHALVRDVAYAELTKADRARMHTGVARWIAGRAGEALGGDAEIVVHHIDAARQFGSSQDLDDLLVDALVAAGEAAVRTDVPRAIPFMERALALMADDDARGLEARLVLARATMTAGDARAARPLLEDLLEGYLREGDDLAAVRVADELESALFALGESDAANTMMAEVRRRIGRSPSQALALLIALETPPSLSGDLQMLGGAESSIAMSESLGLAPSATAIGYRGMARIALGNLEAGREDVDRAASMMLDTGRTQGAFLMIYGGAFELAKWDTAAALQRLDEAIELAGTLGAEANLWEAKALRLAELKRMGRLDAVAAEAEPILDWAKGAGNAFAGAFALGSLATVDLLRGSRAVSIEEYERFERGTFGPGALIGVAELAHGRGQDELARTLLLEYVRALDVSSPSAVPLALELDMRPLALELLAPAGPHTPRDEAARVFAEAAIEADGGRAERAARGYTDAARRFADLGYLVDQARALQALGRCLIELGRTEEAIARLHEARELWVGMTATVRIAEVDELLTRAT